MRERPPVRPVRISMNAKILTKDTCLNCRETTKALRINRHRSWERKSLSAILVHTSSRTKSMQKQLSVVDENKSSQNHAYTVIYDSIVINVWSEMSALTGI